MTQPLRQAAVLIPLARDADQQLRVTLIERSSLLAAHPGQIALPGGSFDPARDPDLLATALRETEEEIGLASTNVTILGALPERRTYTSRFRIQPFVARIAATPSFVVAADEVAAVLTVSIAEFRRPRETFTREHDGQVWHLPCVRLGERTVWGATLDIIDDLLGSPLLDLV